MHVDYLIGLELAGKREHMGYVAALRNGNFCGWDRCSLRFGIALRRVTGN